LSVLDLRLQELHDRLSGGELAVSDLVEASLSRIKETEPVVQAFITLDEEGARAQAAELDKQLKEGGERGLLFGLPAGIKDNIVTDGLKTTCASRFLSNYIPIYNATVMDKLRAAQSVTIGKLNMDEFAMGGSNENSAMGPTRNPWDPERVPGGSSGGSAAAVAARQVYFALGSDTGGSASSLSRLRWIRSVRSRRTSRTRSMCCRRSPAMIRWIRRRPTSRCRITPRRSRAMSGA